MNEIKIPSQSRVAVLCEGNDEKYVIKYLLEKNLLCFTKEQLLPDLNINVRRYYKSPKKFSQDFLGMEYEEGIAIIILKDSDYCHKNVPKLPSFVPRFAMKCTSHCQPVYHQLTSV